MFPSVLLLLDVAAVTASAASASATAPASWSVLSTVLVALFTCAVATACFLWHYRARFVPGVPRPRAVPIFGQTNQILSNLHRHHELMQEFANEVGDGKCFSIGLFHIGRPRRFVTLGANEALTKHVLKDKFDNYIKGPIFYDIFQVLLGEGIFNVDSDQWRRHRKIASWMFSLRHLQEDMLKVFVRNGDSVQTRLTSAAESGEVFDIQDIFFRYTLDSFSEIAFGVNPGCLSHMGTPIPFATAFDTVQRLVNDRFHNPLWALLNFFQIGNEKIITEQSKILNDFAYDVIKHRRQQTETVDGYEQLKANSDLLTRFLVEAQERNRGKYEEEKSQQETQTESTAAASPNQHTRQMTEALTDEELRDVVLNFIIAGRDTTACLLAWAVYELTRNPAWEARLLAAIREKYTATGSYKECGDLAIVKNFLHETLRLHPSVPADMKCAIKDDILPDGTKVYAGDNVGYSPYMFGRSKRLWGEDAEQFKPERWEKESPSEFKFISFNAGPRLCLGKRVAILEAGLLFSMLVNKFTVELAGHSKQHVTYMFTVTMPVKDGLMVKVKARS